MAAESSPIHPQAREETIFDTDFHLNVTADDLLPYVSDARVERKLELGGMPPGTVGGWVATYSHHNVDGLNAHGNAVTTGDIVEVMEEYAIDGAVITPGLINLPTARYDAMKTAIATAHNDFLLEEVVDVGAGVYGCPVLPQWDPDAAEAEVRRIGSRRGIVGFQGWYSPYRMFGSKDFDPVYAALTDEELPLVLHGSGFWPRFDPKSDAQESWAEAVTISWSTNAMANVINMIFTGVFDVHPELEVLVQEAGTNWIPFVANRADEMYQTLPEDVQLTDRLFAEERRYLEHLPSRYLYEHFWYTTQPIALPKRASHAKAMLEMCRAEERFMFSSDWPHATLDVPNWLYDAPGIDDEMRARILAGNARELFGL